MLSKFHKHQSLGHQVVPAQAADFSFFGGLFIEPAELIDERSAGVTALLISIFIRPVVRSTFPVEAWEDK